MDNMLRLIIITLCFQAESVMSLSCEQQYTNVFDTPCAEIYMNLLRSRANYKKMNLSHFLIQMK